MGGDFLLGRMSGSDIPEATKKLMESREEEIKTLKERIKYLQRSVTVNKRNKSALDIKTLVIRDGRPVLEDILGDVENTSPTIKMLKILALKGKLDTSKATIEDAQRALER